MENYGEDSKRNRMYKMLKGVPKNIKERFQYDDEAVWSFTDMGISEGICRRLLEIPGITRKCTITDATASVGGNVIVFAKNFKHINAVELNESRKKMLDFNIALLKLNNITTYCDWSQNIITQTTQDIIFFDPPWGTDYKSYHNLRLDIGGPNAKQTIEDFVIEAFGYCRWFVIKLPNNYDLDYLKKRLEYIATNVHTEWHGRPNTCVILIFAKL